MTAIFTDLDGLVDRIPDGATIAVPEEDAGGCSMALMRRAIQRGVRGLRLVGAHRPGIQLGLLMGAGCIELGRGAGLPFLDRRVDVAIFHVGKVDRHGNVWIGDMTHLKALAQAADAIAATYEVCVAENPGTGSSTAAKTLPAAQNIALAEAPMGSWPLGLPGAYEADEAHLALYGHAAETEDGIQAYLRNHVYQRLAAD